ncbi:MAG: hypothetical protein IJ055_01040 [Oscillospiraceae bacterium]|nr:hypothetical protein [Oscillospiraceae bacterium]
MKRILTLLAALAVCLLCGCSRLSEEALAPLLGLSWFMSEQEVRDALDTLTFEQTRASEDGQTMLDFTDAVLFETDCSLTLCLTGAGLIGLNYHDTAHSRTYREWQAELEQYYGVPTEQGSGMASWYQNPVGKNTAVYLFNLEEGVQVSFYADSTTPDKEEGEEEVRVIPTPELRTPIVPVTEEAPATLPPAADETPVIEVINPTGEGAQEAAPPEAVQEETPTDTPHTLAPGETAASTAVRAARSTKRADAHTTAQTERTGAPASETRTAAVLRTRPAMETQAVRSTEPAAARTTAVPRSTRPSAERVTEAVTEVPTEVETQIPTEEVLDLTFYMDPDAARTQMHRYAQRYEYRTEEPGQPWELIMEYGNVPYEGQNCDVVLCFTSLGLVGINYFDADAGRFDAWTERLGTLYGEPDTAQYDYAAWSGDPVGVNTMIYVFQLEDGVQISFFADDTGSELS